MFRESCLEFSKRMLFFGFPLPRAVKASFQPHEVTPKLKLRQHLSAQSPKRPQPCSGLSSRGTRKILASDTINVSRGSMHDAKHSEPFVRKLTVYLGS